MSKIKPRLRVEWVVERAVLYFRELLHCFADCIVLSDRTIKPNLVQTEMSTPII